MDSSGERRQTIGSDFPLAECRDMKSRTHSMMTCHEVSPGSGAEIQ